MQTAEVIDYAKPLMEAENALKNMHDAALHRDYEMAKEFALQAMSHTRIAMHSCSIMAENNPWEKEAA